MKRVSEIYKLYSKIAMKMLILRRKPQPICNKMGHTTKECYSKDNSRGFSWETNSFLLKTLILFDFHQGFVENFLLFTRFSRNSISAPHAQDISRTCFVSNIIFCWVMTSFFALVFNKYNGITKLIGNWILLTYPILNKIYRGFQK